MRESMNISGAPYDEDCVQVETGKDYELEMRRECKRFMEALRRYYQDVTPAGAWFSVQINAHDFGTYYEVVVNYDDDNTQAELFAYYVESETPGTWDALENGPTCDVDTYQTWTDTKLADMVGDTDDWDDDATDVVATQESGTDDVRSTHPDQCMLWGDEQAWGVRHG